jgi:hypothetical protein
MHDLGNGATHGARPATPRHLCLGPSVRVLNPRLSGPDVSRGNDATATISRTLTAIQRAGRGARR